MKKINQKLLNEYKFLTGLIQEDSYMAVQSILPGLQNSTQMAEEAAEHMKEVSDRLEKIENLLKNDNQDLHLRSESEFLKAQLRNALHKILAAEQPIREAMMRLDSLA